MGATDSPLVAWFRARVRLAPGALGRATPAVRRAFAHDWAPVQALQACLSCLPNPLWAYLLSCPSGLVVIGGGPSAYQTGPAAPFHRSGAQRVLVSGEELPNVGTIALEDLTQGNERPLHVVGHLIDHHLGCGGAAGGAWLSEGGGVRPAWQEAGRRLGVLFGLGHGLDEVARSGVRDYFAQSLAAYCQDRQRLNVADPLVYRWFRATLWNESFWRSEAT